MAHNKAHLATMKKLRAAFANLKLAPSGLTKLARKKPRRTAAQKAATARNFKKMVKANKSRLL